MDDVSLDYQAELDKTLASCAAVGNLDGVRNAHLKGGNPRALLSASLCDSAENGHVDVVRYLIPFSDISVSNYMPLRNAACRERLDCIDELLRHVPEDFDSSDIVVECVSWRSIESVKRLLPWHRHAHGSSLALRWAAERGCEELVSVLLPVSDPKDISSASLFYAATHRHVECVKLLFDVSDIDVVKIKMGSSDDMDSIAFLDSVISAEKLKRKMGVVDSSRCERGL